MIMLLDQRKSYNCDFNVQHKMLLELLQQTSSLSEWPVCLLTMSQRFDSWHFGNLTEFAQKDKMIMLLDQTKSYNCDFNVQYKMLLELL